MSGDRLSLLIIGGYGTFGGRLARLLGDEPRLRLLIAGRSLERRTISLRISEPRKMDPRAWEAAIWGRRYRPCALIVMAIWRNS
jgi:hypothetical protein